MIFDTDIFIWVQRGNTKAAQMIECGLILCTGNAKHFSPIRDLKTKIFRP